MKQNITKEEKLKFYKDFINSSDLNEFNKLNSIYNPITSTSYNVTGILASVCIIGGFFNPWLFLGLIPSLSITLISELILNYKKNNFIKKINSNFSYKDYVEMQKNGEWTLLGYELSAKEMKLNHYAQNSKFVIEEKISKHQNKNISENNNEKNLLIKAEKRKKYNIIDDLDKQIIEDENIDINHNLLSEFAENLGFTIIELTNKKDKQNSKLHKITIKQNNNTYKFMVSTLSFIGIEENTNIDLSAEWQDFLLNKISEKYVF